MNAYNSTTGILVSTFSTTSRLIKMLVLLLISIGMQKGVLLAQSSQSRQQILEKRKAMSDKSSQSYRTNVKSNNRLLRPNGSLCDFTLTPANAANNTLAQIIQSLVGNGVTVSNIQTNLPATSDIYGSFSCGTSVVGIESGLILTSGSIQNVNMPNTFSGFTTENGLPGDTVLLARLTDSTGYDASIVSFDIVSSTNKISFQYVFASDEYNEFVGSEFNDVFGFFISGPGIATNIGINGTRNIALVPNSPAPISINTINNNLNSQYYINNEFEDESDSTRFYHLEYDGLTTVLTATATVQPGSKYTITLAIEDVADELYDCGVFIKGGSITGGECNMVLSATPTPATCPGATNGSINLTITNATAPVTIQWSNGAITEDISNLAPGIYTATVSDASPCQKTLQVTVSSGSSTIIPSVIIAANPAGAICTGTNVTFTAIPTNGGTTPAYQWKRNGNNVGTNSATYQNASLVNGDKITCVMTSALACANPATATSNQITIQLTAAVAPSVAIAANPTGTICTGTNTTFTATPTNGGAAPAYQWKLNGNNVGTNSATYQNATLVNGDKITCVMTSALACANPATATSNQVTMQVTATVAPSVTIAANPTGAICAGTNVTFTATAVGGGSTPNYQWKVGNALVGTNSRTYTTSNLTNGAVVTCILTSTSSCAGNSSVTSAGITMAVSSPPLATITPTGSLNFCLGKSALLRANTGAGYTYQWKKGGVNIAGAIQATYTATIAGVYTVVVNKGGCSTTSTGITIIVNAVPVATITAGGPLTFCTGKSVLLKANTGAGYTYQWKKSGINIAGATLANYSATVSGIYSVVVTNASGCSVTSTVTTVLVNAVPIAKITAGGPLTFCAGKNVLLKANVGTGYTYQWKKGGVNIAGATLANYSATVSGIYTVVVTNATGCAVTSAVTTVLVNAVPIAKITAGGPLTFCAGKNVLLKANVGTGYTYQWKKGGVNIAGATLANYSATVSGIYSVIVTNASGCSVTSTSTTVLVNAVPIAKITAGGPLTFCAGKSVLLKAYAAAGYTFQWKKGAINIAGATLANYTATTSGVYSVVVTNAAGCAITSAVTTVLVNAVPIARITAGGPLTFCTGKNVLLKAYAAAGYTYQWKKGAINIAGATLANYTATGSGAYSVVVTNAAGCSITSATTTVLVNPVPLATITAAGPLIFCAGKNVLLKANTGTGYTYQWKKSGITIAGANLPTYTATATGIYTVAVTNVAGCITTSAGINVTVNPLPLATITPGGPVTIPAGGNVVLKANTGTGYTYQWKKDGVTITGAISNTYAATVAGLYTVIITHPNSCQATSQPVQVSVNPAPLITKGESSFPQAEKEQMNPEPIIKVFPNPLHGDEYLNFEWNISNAEEKVQVTVFDISGRRIESMVLNSPGKKLRIKGVSGIYMVEIRWGNNERKIFRVIKI